LTPTSNGFAMPVTVSTTVLVAVSITEMLPDAALFAT
jgi:hypothetical protein